MRSHFPGIDWSKTNKRVEAEGPVLLAVPLGAFGAPHDCRSMGCSTYTDYYINEKAPPVLLSLPKPKGAWSVLDGLSRLHRAAAMGQASMDVLYLGVKGREEGIKLLLRRESEHRTRPAAVLASLLHQLRPNHGFIDLKAFAARHASRRLTGMDLIRLADRANIEAVKAELGIDSNLFDDLVMMNEMLPMVVNMMYDRVLSADAIATLAVVREHGTQLLLARRAVQGSWDVPRLQTEILATPGAVDSKEQAQLYWERWRAAPLGVPSQDPVEGGKSSAAGDLQGGAQ